MKSSVIDKIQAAEDNYIAVKLKVDTQINKHEFSVVNSNTNILVNCVRDRYEQNCLLYYVQELIPLKEYIGTTQLDFDSLKIIIMNITKGYMLLLDKKLKPSNTILTIDNVFINKYTKDIKFIYIPVISSVNTYEATGSFHTLIKDILNNCYFSNNDEFVEFILSNLNSDEIDIADFYIELVNFNNSDSSDKISGFKNQNISAYLITILSTLFFCIIIPVALSLLNVSIIKKNISLTGILIFSSLFVVASITAVVFNLISYKNKGKVSEENIKFKKIDVSTEQNKNSESAITINEDKKNNIKQNDSNTKLGDLNLTDIRTDFSGPITNSNKINTAPLGNKEYSPINISSQSEVNKRNKTSELGSNSFNPQNLQGAFITKKGNYNLEDRIYIDNELFVIGRNKKNCDFIIEEPSISKEHSIIKKVGDEYFLVDNESSNGTFLNNMKIEPNKEYKLKNGDIISFAKQQFEFLDK